MSCYLEDGSLDMLSCILCIDGLGAMVFNNVIAK